jgi:putative holliday junction resolvase
MGRKLALDIGRARVGIAISDAAGILASPNESIARLADDSETVKEILQLVIDYEIVELYLGDPVSLSGEQTSSTTDARNFAALLQSATSLPVRLVDERLTTISAARNLRESGKDARASKSFIDSASAVVILESVLQTERVSARSAGRAVGDLLGS